MTNGERIKISNDTDLIFDDGLFSISQTIAGDTDVVCFTEDELAEVIEICRRVLEGEDNA